MAPAATITGIQDRSGKFLQSGSARVWILAVLLVTVLAYLPAVRNQFTNWDDDKYIIDNPLIRSCSAENIHAIVSDYCLGNYHPLTLLSYCVDFQIGGMDPQVYHMTNIVLHLLVTSSVLWFVFLLLGNFEMSVLAGLLFGVHPFHVESVAWVSERKDLLYTLFFMLSLVSYLKYSEHLKVKYYVFSLLLFLLSLLSKGQAVSLALSVILLDYFRGRKLSGKRVMLEKIPFFALALVFGIIAIMAQKTGNALGEISTHNFAQQCVFACYGFSLYLLKIVLPLRLSSMYFYPPETQGPLPSVYYLAVFLVLAFFIFLGIMAVKRKKLVVFGLLFFFLNIFFQLQLIPVGRAIAADRYSYLPSLGIFLLVAYLFNMLVSRFVPEVREQKYRKKGPVQELPPFSLRRIRQGKKMPVVILYGVLLLYVVFLSVKTSARCKVWRDSNALWDDVIAHDPTDSDAFTTRAMLKQNSGDVEGSLNDLDKAIRLNPMVDYAYINRGVVRKDKGDLEGALEDFNRAIKLNPSTYEAFNNRGYVRTLLNDLKGAFEDYNMAVKLDPRSPYPYNNRGYVRMKMGEYDSARSDINRSIRIEPGNSYAYRNLGLLDLAMRDTVQACKDFRRALALGFTGKYGPEVEELLKKNCRQH